MTIKLLFQKAMSLYFIQFKRIINYKNKKEKKEI